MSTPVTTLRTVESIGRIGSIIDDDETAHNGFPVVEDYNPDGYEGVSTHPSPAHSPSYQRIEDTALVDILVDGIITLY